MFGPYGFTDTNTTKTGYLGCQGKTTAPLGRLVFFGAKI